MKNYIISYRNQCSLHQVGSIPYNGGTTSTFDLSNIPGYQNFEYGTHIICVPLASYLPECKIDTEGHWVTCSFTGSYDATTGILTITKSLGYKGLTHSAIIYAVY